MNHIDVSSVLRETLACDLYSNLVTRSTGAAVRGQIEQLLGADEMRRRALTVIDFSHVSMIDFSCADEVVANTGFALDVPDQVPQTPLPSTEELRLLREEIDPRGVYLGGAH